LYSNIFLIYDNIVRMKEIIDFENSLSELEERLEKKIRELYKYKKAQLVVKIITLTSISVLLFTRSGRHHDIYLWFIGLYILLVALGEFFDLEELRFYQKEESKKSKK